MSAAKRHRSSPTISTSSAATTCSTSISLTKRREWKLLPQPMLSVQDGRKYFENISFVQRVESYQAPIQTVEIGGAAAVRVYRDEQFAELRIGR